MKEITAADGTRLAYRDEGEGAAILCLAGLTRDGRDFDYLLPHLAGRRVIRPDYRGRGGSGWADPATYSVPQEAADVLALLDHLGLDKRAGDRHLARRDSGDVPGAEGEAPAGRGLPERYRPGAGEEGAGQDQGLCRPAAEVPHTGPRWRRRCRRLYPEFQGVPASRWAEEVAHHTEVTDAGWG